METNDHLMRISAGTFFDRQSGLQWVAFSIGQSSLEDGGYTGEAKLFTWQQLKPLIKKINSSKGFSGHHDWRIPTLQELEGIIEADTRKEIITEDDALEFWTADSDDDTNAWTVSLNQSTPFSKPKIEKAAIRLVRVAVQADHVSEHDELDINLISQTNRLTSLVTSNANNALQQSRATMGAIKEKSLASLQNPDNELRVAQARETISLYRLFWTRILKSDFSVVRANKEEAEVLVAEEVPVLSPIAQDYSSWRRSLLMISLLGLVISLVFKLPSIFNADTASWVIQVQQIALFFIQAGTALLCFLAARSWSNLAKSRSLARLSWLTQFVLPLLIFLLPFSFFVDNQYILNQIGLAALLALAPKIFGLFPGLIRCSLTMKTLLPEASAPGWLAIIIAPLYALLLLIAAIVALQLTEVFLAAGLVFMSISLSVVIFKSEQLKKPQSQADASSAIRSIKSKQLTFQVLGLVLVGLFALKNAELEINWLADMFNFIITYIANVTLLTVVMSDFLLAMIFKGHQQSKGFVQTDMAANLNTRLVDLSACGLTNLEAGEAELAAGLKTRGDDFANRAMAKRDELTKKMATRANSEKL